jgi:hypothetical protein
LPSVVNVAVEVAAVVHYNIYGVVYFGAQIEGFLVFVSFKV